MKIIPINVYSINELQGKAKEKAIAKIKDHLVDVYFEHFFDNAKFYLQNDLNMSDANLIFSLSYSQGDGLRFTTSFFNTDEVIALLDLEESTKATIKNLTQSKDLIVSINDNNPFSRYTYHHKRQVDVNFSEDINDLIPGYMIEKITQAFVDTYLKVCGDLEKQGYDCYEVSENDCIENAKDNDLLYFANGDIFHE